MAHVVVSACLRLPKPIQRMAQRRFHLYGSSRDTPCALPIRAWATIPLKEIRELMYVWAGVFNH